MAVHNVGNSLESSLTLKVFVIRVDVTLLYKNEDIFCTSMKDDREFADFY